ncbi:serine aminopeptidase domain-containing protein [Streptomyces sp. NPDC014734]|uniref:serine aminopeptidase domain-containing protein n=1 Tax=Streptomyces sp. NPDC014734 TaxID=3364886 RepID=UPI0036FF9C5B
MTERRPSPSAAVLLLHGGRETGLGPPPPGPLNLPALRMRPFARAVAGAPDEGAGDDVLVRSVRYSHRGWNGPREDPFHDAMDALDALRREAGEVPVVLLGHSMGARAALRAAGHPLVRGVVGLAPWCPADDPVAQLADRDVILIHSTRDRITSPRESQSFTGRARRAGARACLVAIRGSDHAMLRRAGAWHTLTARIVAGLLGAGPLPVEIAAAFRLPQAATATQGTLDFDRLDPAHTPSPAAPASSSPASAHDPAGR